MDMRTELIAVPHAGLGFHFLRVPVGSHRILEVLKGKEAQSTRRGRRSGRSDGVPCVTAANLKIKQFKRIPVTTRDTLMDMRTELIAVPHTGLGLRFLRVPVGSHRILEVLKGKEAQSTRSRSAIRSK